VGGTAEHNRRVSTRIRKGSSIAISSRRTLVTMHEGWPVLSVIDFGIAKAINQRLSAATIHTLFSHMGGTPLERLPGTLGVEAGRGWGSPRVAELAIAQL
jgi:hypothetical protein